MDEVLLRQLVRQMKFLNFWITLFGTLFLAAIVIAGILLFKLVTFVHNTDQQIQKLQSSASSTLDLKKQACSDAGLASLLSRTGYCN